MLLTRKILPALALFIAFAPLAAHAQNAHAAPQTVQVSPIMVGSATIDQPTTIYSGGVYAFPDSFGGQEWRRKDCENHRHENMSVTFPFVLPTWPFGWLRPMLMEIEVPPEGFPNQMFPDSDG